MKERIGIFGGTFDPIHLGHVAMALFLKEAHQLNQLFFIPAGQNPHKVGKIAASKKHRLKMVELALKDVPGCKVLDLEITRKGPSYMIDTLKKLSTLYPKASFFLLLGEDLLSTIDEWKSVHQLFQMAPPLVAARKSAVLQGKWQKDPILKKMIEKGRTETSLFDISATEIRTRIKEGLYVGHLLHPRVLRYIEKERLYK